MFDELMKRIDRLRLDIAGKPELRWGVVTALSPLAVRLDGDTDPLAGSPSTLVGSSRVGDRVQLAIQNRRATIVGTAYGGSTDWASISFVSPHTGTCQWRRYHGMVQVRWECTSTIAANALVNPLFVVPEQITPVIPASATLYGNGGVPYTGRISSNRNAQIRNNGTAASGGHSGWCEYPAN